MKRLPPQDRMTMALGLVVAVAVAVVLLAVLPLHGKARQLERESKSLQAKISEAQTMYRRLPTEAERVAALRKQIRASCRPQQNPNPEVVRELEQLTSDLGLQAVSIRPSEPALVDNYTKFATTVEVQSSFENIVRLLYELETPPHSLWVDGVEINSDQMAGSDLRASVTVAVYVYTPADRKTDAET